MSAGPLPIATPRKRRRRGRRLLLVLCATLASVLLLEGLIRVRHWMKYGSFGAIYEFVVDPESGLSIPPAGRNGPIEIDSRGFRSPELVVPKPSGTTRIAFLGGSTTYCAEASGNAATWPALVVARLGEAEPTRRFDWLNAGVGGYSVEHSVRNLEHRVAKLQPDVVVIYHLTNDLTKDTRVAAAAQGLWEDGGEGWLERHSMLWSILKKNVLLKLRGNSDSPQIRPIVAFDPRVGARGFEERLVALIEAAKRTAKVVAVATFSHRVRPEQDAAQRSAACASSFYYMPFMSADGILAGVAAYNGAIRRAAERTGAVLIEGEDSIPADDEHFNDSVHLKDAGCVLMGKRVADALLRDGVLAPALR